jgi:hypothetical protein
VIGTSERSDKNGIQHICHSFVDAGQPPLLAVQCPGGPSSIRASSAPDLDCHVRPGRTSSARNHLPCVLIRADPTIITSLYHDRQVHMRHTSCTATEYFVCMLTAI